MKQLQKRREFIFMIMALCGLISGNRRWLGMWEDEADLRKNHV
jgi:hypothetical protein